MIKYFPMSLNFLEKRVMANWEGRGTLLEGLVLKGISHLYRGGLEVYRSLYSLGLKSPLRLPVPVVSVGNITLGGTGKTPMVAWLARELKARGFKVVVVSRGYGGRSSREVLLVSRGNGPLVSVEEGGDEPVMLARKLEGVPVVVAWEKARGAKWAVEHLGAQMILLDDGFQHWALARDLDMVLVNGERGLGNGLLFPAGPLREPLEALARAHILVITKEENPALLKRLVGEAPMADIYQAPWRVLDLRSPTTGETMSLESLKGVRVGAFAGIAYPSSFFDLLRGLGGSLVETEAFPDHHFYGDADVKRLADMASRVDIMITTEKDGERLGNVPFPFWVLRVALEPPIELVDRVLERLGLTG